MVSIDPALQAAVLWFAAGTLILLAVGKAAVAGRAARLAMTLAVGVVLAGLARLFGLDPVAEVEVGVPVLVLCLVGPARWRAGGAILWGGMVACTGVYLMYLVRATFLLGSTPESALLGTVLLAAELGATALILGPAFEIVDALCSPSDVPALPPAPAHWPLVCLQAAVYNNRRTS
jgi:hypothetical protein